MTMQWGKRRKKEKSGGGGSPDFCLHWGASSKTGQRKPTKLKIRTFRQSRFLPSVQRSFSKTEQRKYKIKDSNINFAKQSKILNYRRVPFAVEYVVQTFLRSVMLGQPMVLVLQAVMEIEPDRTMRARKEEVCAIVPDSPGPASVSAVSAHPLSFRGYTCCAILCAQDTRVFSPSTKLALIQ